MERVCFFVLKGAGWIYGEDLAASNWVYMSATAACMSAITMMQSVNVFPCRSSVQSVLTKQLLSNRLILAGVAVETISMLLIVYTPDGPFVRFACCTYRCSPRWPVAE